MNTSARKHLDRMYAYRIQRLIHGRSYSVTLSFGISMASMVTSGTLGFYEPLSDVLHEELTDTLAWLDPSFPVRPRY